MYQTPYMHPGIVHTPTAETVAEAKEPVYQVPFQASQIVPWVSAAVFLFLYLVH